MKELNNTNKPLTKTLESNCLYLLTININSVIIVITNIIKKNIVKKKKYKQEFLSKGPK